MKKKIPFFVGWQGKLPTEQRAFLKKNLIAVFLLIPVIAFLIVSAQKPFNKHIFQFGNITNHSGIFHKNPVPILEVMDESLPEGVSNYMLLVGFGKFGAESIIATIEETSGSLDKAQITLQGTLIYGDGKAVLELTKKEESLVTRQSGAILSSLPEQEVVTTTKTGEILDPKCYFGVMKPGEGKIHKSCAIRCISGGIPPVFRIEGDDGSSKYAIVLGPDGEKINSQLLKHVGEKVRINGSWTNESGWGVLYTDPGDIIRVNNE